MPERCFTRELCNHFFRAPLNCKVFFCISQEICQPNTPNSFVHNHTSSGPSWAEKLQRIKRTALSCSFSLVGVHWQNVSQLSQRNTYQTVIFHCDICKTAVLSFWVVKTHLVKCFSGAERTLTTSRGCGCQCTGSARQHAVCVVSWWSQGGHLAGEGLCREDFMAVCIMQHWMMKDVDVNMQGGEYSSAPLVVMRQSFSLRHR